MSRNNSSLMMDADTLEKAAQTYIDNVKKWALILKSFIGTCIMSKSKA